MNRRLLLSFALAIGIAACKPAAPEQAGPTPTKEIVAGVEMIDYDDGKGGYACLAPRLWGIEEGDGATFVGPRDPKTAGGAYITILRYPGSSQQWSDPRKYAESFWKVDPKREQPALEERKIGDSTVIFLHQERPFYKLHSSKAEYMLRYDFALIPVEGGFFAISHRAPLNAYAATLPVFEAVVKSFRPKR